MDASSFLSQLDQNHSVWAAENPPPAPLPSLSGRCAADVAIIGGGLTGVSTAWHLAQRFPDRRIVLLEARQLGNGGSGRNGGLMLTGASGEHGSDLALERRLYELMCEGMELIGQIIRTHQLRVSYRRDGALKVLTHPRRAEGAALWVERWNAAGIPLAYLDASRMDIELDGAVAAVRDPMAGHVDGLALVRGMREVLLNLGVTIYEDTPVLRVEEGATIRLHTPSGDVRAGAVVLATNAYTPQLGYFRREVLPIHSHVVATAPRSAAEWAAMGWRGGSGFSDDLGRVGYSCLTNGGQVVFGGGSNAAYDFRYGGRTSLRDPPHRGYRAVERRLRRYLPRAAAVPVAHRWSGAVALTLDRECAIGVRGEHRNVYYALGYSGQGLVMSVLAGRILRDAYSGEDAEWRPMPFYDRRMGGFPPEPLRWLGYKVVTALTGRSPRK